MKDTSEEIIPGKDKDEKDIYSFNNIIAFLSLVGLAIFIMYILRHYISATELEWTRVIYIFTAVEAVSFAAAGFLFGKDVHRVRAERAEEKVNKCQEIASSALERANVAETKGEGLASLIQTKAKMFSDVSQTKCFVESESSLYAYISIKNSLDELAVYAAEQFPK